jgi:hypothetical protein
MNQRVNSLIQKEVSRKEFLGMSGLAVASIFGFGTIIKLITGKSFSGGHTVVGGYGASAYGGSKESH